MPTYSFRPRRERLADAAWLDSVHRDHCLVRASSRAAAAERLAQEFVREGARKNPWADDDLVMFNESALASGDELADGMIMVPADSRKAGYKKAQ